MHGIGHPVYEIGYLSTGRLIPCGVQNRPPQTGLPRFHRRRSYYGLQRFLVDSALCIEVPIRFGIVAAHDLSSSAVRRSMNGAATFVLCWRHFFAPAFAFAPLY